MMEFLTSNASLTNLQRFISSNMFEEFKIWGYLKTDGTQRNVPTLWPALPVLTQYMYVNKEHLM